MAIPANRSAALPAAQESTLHPKRISLFLRQPCGRSEGRSDDRHWRRDQVARTGNVKELADGREGCGVENILRVARDPLRDAPTVTPVAGIWYKRAGSSRPDYAVLKPASISAQQDRNRIRAARPCPWWLPFVDTFRTFCLDPGPEGKALLSGIAQIVPLFSSAAQEGACLQ
jgi:hypothetical protein